MKGARAPTWALDQKAAANRQVIAIMCQRLAAGEEVARMYQEPGLAWLERQAEVAEELVAPRKRTAKNRPINHQAVLAGTPVAEKLQVRPGEGAWGQVLAWATQTSRI